MRACTFAGSDLRDLYITTAARGDKTPGAGALYRYRNPTPGLPPFRSRVKTA